MSVMVIAEGYKRRRTVTGSSCCVGNSDESDYVKCKEDRKGWCQ